MTDLKPNAELAYRVLDHIDAHPEQWRQGVYIGKAECGTVACFAGWACLLSGGRPNFWNERPDAVTDEVIFEGVKEVVSGRAEDLLRASRYIDEDTEYEIDLFSAENTREDLGRYVEEIFGPRPAVTP